MLATQQHRLKLIEPEPRPDLPTLATPADLREVVQLLKTKPRGIPIVEAADAIRKRLLDSRKLIAYEHWGVITRTSDRITLTTLGWELARALKPQISVFRNILQRVGPYRAMLEFIQQDRLEIVTFAEVAIHWQSSLPETTKESNPRELEGGVACFFQLCHAAEIGTATAGRKGQPTRLRVDRKELAAFLLNGPTPVGQEPEEHRESVSQKDNGMLKTNSADAARVFISYGENSGIVDRLREALEVSGIDCEVVQRNQGSGNLVAEATLEAIQKCQIGLVLITEADFRKDADGNIVLDEKLLVEIGAAFVHFERRVVLLCRKGYPVPGDLGDLQRCEFEGEDLTWSKGIEVLRAIQRFRDK